MSEIINWVRSGESTSETYFVATYGSSEQEQTVLFYSREEYQELFANGSELFESKYESNILMIVA